jgi:hypothetical protein
MSGKIWVTRKGIRLVITKMTTVHIQNTIKLLERNAEKIKEDIIQSINLEIDSGFGIMSSVRGEMALDEIVCGLTDLEHELNSIRNTSALEILHESATYGALNRELLKRSEIKYQT